MELEALLNELRLGITSDEIYRAVTKALNRPDATASSLARAVAEKIGESPLPVIADEKSREVAARTNRIIDCLVGAGVVRFDGRRPMLGRPPPRASRMPPRPPP